MSSERQAQQPAEEAKMTMRTTKKRQLHPGTLALSLAAVAAAGQPTDGRRGRSRAMSTRKATNITNRRFSPRLSPALAVGVALFICWTAAPAQAQVVPPPSCPKEITNPTTCPCAAISDVTLKTDVVCMNTDGIIVMANGITVRFNGFRLLCKDPMGFGLSCQGGTVAKNTGVRIIGRSNVNVIGGGAIQGFDTGVLIDGGFNNRVQKLNVTAPDADLGTFATSGGTPGDRPPTEGIRVQFTSSSANIDIFANSVDNHTKGILLQSAQGVGVRLNFAHDNNGGISSNGLIGNESHGIHLVDSDNNLIHNNLIVDNGVNVPDDSGIMLDGSFFNRINSNNVSFSNGDGISVRQGAANNVIDNNQVLYNTSAETLSTFDPSRVFRDLFSKAGAGVNTFNANNRCETQGNDPGAPAIPTGVCKSGEGEAWTK
jgi:parallel beta-helix repeat protein